MRIFVVLFSSFTALFFSTQAQALTDISYLCEVTLVSSRVQKGAVEWKFQAPLSSGSHGGEPRSFVSGPFEIQVVADAQWIGIRWLDQGRRVAESLFALGNQDRTMYRVGVLYNPEDEDAQVSVGCSEGVL